MQHEDGVLTQNVCNFVKLPRLLTFQFVAVLQLDQRVAPASMHGPEWAADPSLIECCVLNKVTINEHVLCPH